MLPLHVEDGLMGKCHCIIMLVKTFGCSYFKKHEIFVFVETIMDLSMNKHWPTQKITICNFCGLAFISYFPIWASVHHLMNCGHCQIVMIIILLHKKLLKVILKNENK